MTIGGAVDAVNANAHDPRNGLWTDPFSESNPSWVPTASRDDLGRCKCAVKKWLELSVSCGRWQTSWNGSVGGRIVARINRRETGHFVRKHGTGLEPAHSEALSAGPVGNCDAGNEVDAAPALRLGDFDCHCVAESEADLQFVLHSWNSLTSEVRDSVVTLIRRGNHEEGARKSSSEKTSSTL